MSLKWQDNSAIAKNLNYPKCLFDKFIASWDVSEARGTNGGILLSDGIHARVGGKVAGAGSPTAWAGYGFKDVGMFLNVSPGTNQAEIQKSVDGIADFTVVHPPAGKVLNTLQRQLVDCGRHTLDDPKDVLGDVERRVLIYFEYSAKGEGNAWYSAQPVNADAGNVGTWHELWSVEGDAAAIDHFHGGAYVYGKGLYVMTGDGDGGDDTQASILFCGDIASLIELPATWFTRWGLGAGDRDAWGTDYHSAYVLGAGGQKWRTVDLVTADSRYLYYIPDANPSSFGGEGNRIIKVDIWDATDSAAGTISVIKTGLSNYGWYGGASKSGLVYISNISYFSSGDLAAGSNGKAEIWVVDPEDDSCELVKSFEPGKGYYDPSRASVIPADGWFGLITGMIDFGGAMCATLTMKTATELGGKLNIVTSICGNAIKQKKVAPENVVLKPSFEDGDFTGYRTNTNSNELGFTDGNVEILVDDVIVGELVDGVPGTAPTATVASVTKTSGLWDGTAVGYITLDNDVEGLFNYLEDITVTGGKSAVLSGIVTQEVIPDPTGQIGGNVVRLVTNHNVNVESGAGALFRLENLTQDQKNKIEGNFLSFSCKMYIAESVGAPAFFMGIAPRKGEATVSRSDTAEASGEGNVYTQQWLTLQGSTVSQLSGALHWYYFQPTIVSSTDVGVFYLTDFRLIKGGLADAAIVQLEAGSSGGRYSGGGRYGG